VKKRDGELSPKVSAADVRHQISLSQSPSLSPADTLSNLTSSFLAHSLHPKTEKKKLNMKSSLGSYGSLLRHDPIIPPVIVNHPNYLIHIMILYRRGGPGMVLVNGNEKEIEIEVHGNEKENPPMPRVEATLFDSFLIIAKMLQR